MRGQNVLNGSYGALTTQYFILFNNDVAGTITAEGRELTKTMSKKNEDYWFNLWHKDTELHKKMFIKNVEKITDDKSVSVYGDTDSIFVGFDYALKSCDWKDRVFNEHWLNNCPRTYSIISSNNIKIDIDNNNFKEKYLIKDIEDKSVNVDTNVDVILVSGDLVKNPTVDEILSDFKGKVIYNWGHELDFIQGMDKFRIADYFKDELNKHAAKYGVDNIQDFELEKISESIINIEKKKYIQHITWEDGIEYDRFSYFQPKGVELIRSGTAVFARDKDMGIYKVVKYLFNHPDDFNVQELMGIIKGMRKEFELADINDISGQSSCSNYSDKVINDKDGLEFVKGAHFGVKAAGHYNYLLNQHKELQTKYEFLKSGDKIKYYYTTLDGDYEKFAFKRGEYPIEFAPPIDYDTQFEKVILSPINGIIKKLNMPVINKRLSVLGDIFSGL